MFALAHPALNPETKKEKGTIAGPYPSPVRFLLFACLHVFLFQASFVGLLWYQHLESCLESFDTHSCSLTASLGYDKLLSPVSLATEITSLSSQQQPWPALSGAVATLHTLFCSIKSLSCLTSSYLPCRAYNLSSCPMLPTIYVFSFFFSLNKCSLGSLFVLAIRAWPQRQSLSTAYQEAETSGWKEMVVTQYPHPTALCLTTRHHFQKVPQQPQTAPHKPVGGGALQSKHGSVDCVNHKSSTTLHIFDEMLPAMKGKWFGVCIGDKVKPLILMF